MQRDTRPTRCRSLAFNDYSSISAENRPEGARPALLSRVRLAGVLHGADRAGPGRRRGRPVRRPGLFHRRRNRLRLTAAPVDRASLIWIERHTYELWETVRPLYEAASTGRQPSVDASCSRRIPTIPGCCTTSRAARAWWGTDDAIEHLRLAIGCHEPVRSLAAGDSTSIRSATSPRSESWLSPLLTAPSRNGRPAWCVEGNDEPRRYPDRPGRQR